MCRFNLLIDSISMKTLSRMMASTHRLGVNIDVVSHSNLPYCSVILVNDPDCIRLNHGQHNRRRMLSAEGAICFGDRSEVAGIDPAMAFMNCKDLR